MLNGGDNLVAKLTTLLTHWSTQGFGLTLEQAARLVQLCGIHKPANTSDGAAAASGATVGQQINEAWRTGDPQSHFLWLKLAKNQQQIGAALEAKQAHDAMVRQHATEMGKVQFVLAECNNKIIRNRAELQVTREKIRERAQEMIQAVEKEMEKAMETKAMEATKNEAKKEVQETNGAMNELTTQLEAIEKAASAALQKAKEKAASTEADFKEEMETLLDAMQTLGETKTVTAVREAIRKAAECAQTCNECARKKDAVQKELQKQTDDIEAAMDELVRQHEADKARVEAECAAKNLETETRLQDECAAEHVNTETRLQNECAEQVIKKVKEANENTAATENKRLADEKNALEERVKNLAKDNAALKSRVESLMETMARVDAFAKGAKSDQGAKSANGTIEPAISLLQYLQSTEFGLLKFNEGRCVWQDSNDEIVTLEEMLKSNAELLAKLRVATTQNAAFDQLDKNCAKDLKMKENALKRTAVQCRQKFTKLQEIQSKLASQGRQSVQLESELKIARKDLRKSHQALKSCIDQHKKRNIQDVAASTGRLAAQEAAETAPQHVEKANEAVETASAELNAALAEAKRSIIQEKELSEKTRTRLLMMLTTCTFKSNACDKARSKSNQALSTAEQARKYCLAETKQATSKNAELQEQLTLKQNELDTAQATNKQLVAASENQVQTAKEAHDTQAKTIVALAAQRWHRLSEQLRKTDACLLKYEQVVNTAYARNTNATKDVTELGAQNVHKQLLELLQKQREAFAQLDVCKKSLESCTAANEAKTTKEDANWQQRYELLRAAIHTETQKTGGTKQNIKLDVTGDIRRAVALRSKLIDANKTIQDLREALGCNNSDKECVDKATAANKLLQQIEPQLNSRGRRAHKVVRVVRGQGDRSE